MQSWLGVSSEFIAADRILGVHVDATTLTLVEWPVLSRPRSGAVALQSGPGDVGGMVMAVLLLLALGLIGVAVWQKRLSGIVGRVVGSSDTDVRKPEPEEAGPSADDAGTGGGMTAEPEPEPQPVEQEEEPQTDQELIVEILEDNDGRMKQARIVDATGWSKSKVSMLLSDMEDEEAISKLRVGRENIISLEGSEPDAAGSPFENE